MLIHYSLFVKLAAGLWDFHTESATNVQIRENMDTLRTLSSPINDLNFILHNLISVIFPLEWSDALVPEVLLLRFLILMFFSLHRIEKCLSFLLLM